MKAIAEGHEFQRITDAGLGDLGTTVTFFYQMVTTVRKNLEFEFQLDLVNVA